MIGTSQKRFSTTTSRCAHLSRFYRRAFRRPPPSPLLCSLAISRHCLYLITLNSPQQQPFEQATCQALLCVTSGANAGQDEGPAVKKWNYQPYFPKIFARWRAKLRKKGGVAGKGGAFFFGYHNNDRFRLPPKSQDSTLLKTLGGRGADAAGAQRAGVGAVRRRGRAAAVQRERGQDGARVVHRDCVRAGGWEAWAVRVAPRPSRFAPRCRWWWWGDRGRGCMRA